MTLREVSHTPKLILDPNNPSPDLTSASIFQIIDGTVLESRGKLVKNFVLRAADNADGVLTEMLDNMKKTRYIAAGLLVDAASAGVAPSLAPFKSTAKSNGLQAFPYHVSVDMISDPWTLVTHCTNAAGRTIPPIGRMVDERKDLYISNDIDSIRRKLLKWVKLATSSR